MDQRTAKQNPATSGPGLSTVSNALAGGAYVFNSTTGAPSAQASQNPNETRNRARAALQNLLAGSAPDGIDPATLGAYSEAYRALVDAHAAGGTRAVRTVFDTLARANPALGFLVGTDPEPAKVEWTTAELLAAQFPEPKWAVPGLVPVGLTFLAGRPKLGKSWLGLQIAVAVGTGGRVFDQVIDPGRVLYLALEDSPRRLQERLTKQRAPAHAQAIWRNEWPALAHDGLDALASAIVAEQYSLVVIDTFSRSLGGADQDDLAEMTRLAGEGLQRLALALDVAILVIDHHRKRGAMAANPIDDLLGSTGKAGAADAVLGLYKEQGKKGALLAVSGRDLEERTLAVEWDALTWCWQCLGEADDVQEGTRKADISEAIAALVTMGQLPTIATIADHCDMKRPHVSRAINDLVTAGKIVRGTKQGREVPYYLAGQVPSV